MGKDISAGLLPYFFRPNVTILSLYYFSIDAPDDHQFIANSKDLGSFTALAIKRNTIRSEEGTIINELEIGLDNVDLAFKNDIIAGKYNDKKCKIYLAFYSGVTYLGKQLIFQGFIDEPKGDEHWVTVTIRPFPLLEQTFPKRVYQSGCNWTFCATGCNLNLNNYTVNTSLTAQSDGQTLICSHGEAADYFLPGFVELTSGVYDGQARPVVSNTTGTIILRIPFEGVLANGTTLEVVKLCPKHYEACQSADFDNFDNYGGYPWVPQEPIL